MSDRMFQVQHASHCTVGGDKPCTCFVGVWRKNIAELERRLAAAEDALREAVRLLDGVTQAYTNYVEYIENERGPLQVQRNQLSIRSALDFIRQYDNAARAALAPQEQQA